MHMKTIAVVALIMSTHSYAADDHKKGGDASARQSQSISTSAKAQLPFDNGRVIVVGDKGAMIVMLGAGAKPETLNLALRLAALQAQYVQPLASRSVGDEQSTQGAGVEGADSPGAGIKPQAEAGSEQPTATQHKAQNPGSIFNDCSLQ